MNIHQFDSKPSAFNNSKAFKFRSLALTAQNIKTDMFLDIRMFYLSKSLFKYKVSLCRVQYANHPWVRKVKAENAGCSQSAVSKHTN